MKTSLSSFVFVALCMGAAAIHAEEWPTKPVRMLVGSSPAGGTDALARAIADKLGPALKTTVVVENKPGASNTLAADATARSTDGRTMVMGVSTAHAIVPHILKLPYDNDRDLVPVAFVAAVPNVLVVNAQMGISTVAQLVEMAKKKPGQINFASSGSGSTQHIAAELFEEATGVGLTHIPYRGSGPALIDLMAGQIQLSFDTMASILPYVKSGKIKALAVLSNKRSAQLPQVPTLAEAGVKGVDMSAWYGIYMPSATPKDVQVRVHAEVAKILLLPETRARFDALGAEIMPMTQAQFASFHAAENKRYAEIVKRRNIKSE